MRETYVADVAAAWPDFFGLDSPGRVVSAIEIEERALAGRMGDHDPYASPAVGRALPFVLAACGNGPGVLQLTLGSEIDTLSHQRVSFWARHPDAASAPPIASVSTAAGGRLHLASLSRVTGVDGLRKALAAPSPWRRASILEYRAIDVRRFLDDVVAATGYTDVRFPVVGLIPATVRLAASQECCVIRSWVGDDASYAHVFGPADVVERFWVERE